MKFKCACQYTEEELKYILFLLDNRYRKIFFDINGRDNRTFNEKLQEAPEKKEFELLNHILKLNGVLEEEEI